MKPFQGQALSWAIKDRVIELVLRREPCNEIGSKCLEELERFASVLPELEQNAHSLILYSDLACGFCAGADLRELYQRSQEMKKKDAIAGVRKFLERIHHVMNTLDACPIPTIAAVHGIVFGGGLELALTCDLIIADKTARFCFPELRLGLIPGFGGVPRLKRDLGNAVVLTATTDATGAYSFTGLTAGTYALASSYIPNYVPTAPSAGTVGGVADGSVLDATDIGSIVLHDGDQGVNYNFGQFIGS